MAVFKKNGNWWIDTYLNGRRIRRKVGPDKRTAGLAEKDLKVRAARGEWLGVQQMKRTTFKAFCREFLNRQAGKAMATVTNYEVSIRLHFVPFFGDRYLPDIRPKHIEDYKQERARAAKPGSVNLELVLLGAIFNAAAMWGYLKENPARQVKPLRVPEREPPYLTLDQVAILYPECHDWLHTFVALALNTGMRLSEILALEWKDIDTRNRVIKVRCDETFTTKGRRNRVLPINDFLYGVLRKAPKHIKNPRVIFTRKGQPLPSESVRQRLTRARKRAGLPHLRIHDLRHTFGTHLAASGVDVATIQKLMGHRDIKTTMKYLHAAPDRMRWAVNNLRLDGTTQEEVDGVERKEGQEKEGQAQA